MYNSSECNKTEERNFYAEIMFRERENEKFSDFVTAKSRFEVDFSINITIPLPFHSKLLF